MDIRKEIAINRAKRIKSEGYGLSVVVPKKREFPLNNFNQGPWVICEVKRGSPSKGKFAEGLNAIEQASIYQKSGVKHVSVLTEEDRFYGSLKDLMDIKRNCPELSVLRKDFLLDDDDIKTSYLCGADGFLLIASLLEKEDLYRMYKIGIELGMTPLVELHDEEDVKKVLDLKPQLVGINSRNLKDFTIDPLRPLKIRSYITWECSVIYESGIKTRNDAEFAHDCDFSGVLVGEWAVKKKGLANELIQVFKSGKKVSPWNKLFKKYNDSKPFIKICGITNRDDAILAKDLGADMLGFILADSPRRVTVDFIKSIKDIDGPLKVGVVVFNDKEPFPKEYTELIKSGYLDFIQFHGDESPEYCNNTCVPYYKAFRIKDQDSFKDTGKYSLVDLVDSFSSESYGGSGKLINKDYTLIARKNSNLWLAGGLNPENIKEIYKEFKPELVDVSSGVELKPGIKIHDKMRKFFEELL